MIDLTVSRVALVIDNDKSGPAPRRAISRVRVGKLSCATEAPSEAGAAHGYSPSLAGLAKRMGPGS